MRHPVAAPFVLASVLTLTALTSGCMPVHVLVAPRIPENEIVIKPALVEFLKSAKDPKIVLRVPTPQGQVTQEDYKASEAMNSVYNVIEKELLKAGFTVRDRALLTEVLRNNPKLDYRTIKEKIDTQLILEIVSFTPWDYSNSDFKRVADGRAGTVSPPFKLTGSRVMAKLILVETGEIGGIVTYYPWPNDWECYFIFDEGTDPLQVRVASKAGVADDRYSGYEVPPEMGASWFIRGMLQQIRR